jgi:hypothetical protein
MFQPAHVDGRSLVLVRQTRWGYERVESGFLSDDGESLWLEVETGEYRRITDDELSRFLQVTENNRIAPCKGFDFFILLSPDCPASKS